MSHQPLTDTELRDLVARRDDSKAANQLVLSYAALRRAFEAKSNEAELNLNYMLTLRAKIKTAVDQIHKITLWAELQPDPWSELRGLENELRQLV